MLIFEQMKCVLDMRNVAQGSAVVCGITASGLVGGCC